MEKSPTFTLSVALSLCSHMYLNDFVQELELLPADLQANECIAYPLAIEQELMEGSYRSLWDASAKMPCPEYAVRFPLFHPYGI